MKKIDWANQKYNMLTIKNETNETDKYGHRLWEVLCDCGIMRKFFPSDVKNGRIKSCGCLRTKTKDWSNRRFGRLLILNITKERANKSKNRGCYKWLAQCDCGNKCLVIPSSCAAGKTFSCGCLHKEIISSTGFKNRKYHPIISSARTRWTNGYKDGNISFEEFYKLSQMNCYYCNAPPSRVYNMGNDKCSRSAYQKEEGDFIYNGLDRLDSSKGHDIDNVVPCCSSCNSTKNENSVDDFFKYVEKKFKHLEKIYNNHCNKSVSESSS